ncbi:3-oxoadipate enol-lactonase [Dyella sp. 333MFSha]|nr:3-oxoadipate enol-lactonase [Dyella sp. 333MFSha]
MLGVLLRGREPISTDGYVFVNDFSARAPDAIHVVRSGPPGASPIVFLHALGLDLGIWDAQFGEFAGDRDVVALDLPGHGLSGAPDGAPTFEAIATQVAETLASLDIASAHVVGISFGGMVAQALAIEQPSMVRSLTLVATSCTFPETVRQMLRDRARATRDGGMAIMAEAHLARWFPEAFRAQHPEVSDRFRKLLHRQDPSFHASLWDLVATLDLKDRLTARFAETAIPLMVIVGEDDASAPVAAGQLMCDQARDAVLHVVPKCGHFPPVEYPGRFNAFLREFLRD